LITAASRRVPLVHGFQRALRQSLDGGVVVVTDVNPLSPAVYAADRAFRVPMATAPGYIDEILDELVLFGEAADRFADHGIVVAVPSAKTTSLCNDKYATCRELQRHGICAATSWLPHELPAHPEFPLFVKPRFGRGGVGAFPIRDASELTFFLTYVTDPIVQQFLDGPEYTIDMLCDFSGRPMSIVPRRRDVIRAGVIDRGGTVKDPRIIALAEHCASAIPFRAAVNIQCRVVDGQPIIFEINPRFSGGIPLTIESGADFPRMLVELAAGRGVAPSIGRFRDQLWMTSYEASVFLQDTHISLPDYPPAASVGAVA
jgi:carbamoyl-phosphate synthase large subunit